MSDSLYKPREKYYCHYSYQEQAICAYRWTRGGVGVEKCQNFVDVFYSWSHIVCVLAKACGSDEVPLDVFIPSRTVSLRLQQPR